MTTVLALLVLVIAAVMSLIPTVRKSGFLAPLFALMGCLLLYFGQLESMMGIVSRTLGVSKATAGTLLFVLLFAVLMIFAWHFMQWLHRTRKRVD